MTSGHLAHNNSLSRQRIHPITTELAFFLRSVWHSRQSRYHFHIISMHSKNSAVIRLRVTVVRIIRYSHVSMLKMFVHQLHSFQSYR